MCLLICHACDAAAAAAAAGKALLLNVSLSSLLIDDGDEIVRRERSWKAFQRSHTSMGRCLKEQQNECNLIYVDSVCIHMMPAHCHDI
jgi:hypothetical protein